jgi:hypothetical protein
MNPTLVAEYEQLSLTRRELLQDLRKSTVSHEERMRIHQRIISTETLMAILLARLSPVPPAPISDSSVAELSQSTATTEVPNFMDPSVIAVAAFVPGKDGEFDGELRQRIIDALQALVTGHHLRYESRWQVQDRRKGIVLGLKVTKAAASELHAALASLDAVVPPIERWQTSRSLLI